MQTEMFEDFAEKLVTAKGIQVGDDDISKKLKQQMVKDLSVRVRNYVLRKLLDSLNNQELADLQQATDEDDEKKAQAIFKGKTVEIARALAAFRDRYMGVV